MRSLLSYARVTLASVLLSAVTVSMAAPIVVRTGVDAGLGVLGSGSLDPAWTISTDGGGTFGAAKVLYSVAQCCGMATVTGEAAWISDASSNAANASSAWGINRNVYLRRSFDLSGYDLSTVFLTGLWRLADWTFGIYLNGALITGTDIGNCGGDQGACGTWFSDHALNVAAGGTGFVSGMNTLEFRGQSINSVYDGLWFSGTVDGRKLPEPGSLLLVGAALLGLAAARRCRA